jgi:hypothetical protein
MAEAHGNPADANNPPRRRNTNGNRLLGSHPVIRNILLAIILIGLVLGYAKMSCMYGWWPNNSGQDLNLIVKTDKPAEKSADKPAMIVPPTPANVPATQPSDPINGLANEIRGWRQDEKEERKKDREALTESMKTLSNATTQSIATGFETGMRPVTEQLKQIQQNTARTRDDQGRPLVYSQFDQSGAPQSPATIANAGTAQPQNPPSSTQPNVVPPQPAVNSQRFDALPPGCGKPLWTALQLGDGKNAKTSMIFEKVTAPPTKEGKVTTINLMDDNGLIQTKMVVIRSKTSYSERGTAYFFSLYGTRNGGQDVYLIADWLRGQYIWEYNGDIYYLDSQNKVQHVEGNYMLTQFVPNLSGSDK